VDSAPASSANPAQVGQEVAFTIGANSSQPLSYVWDFGDGTVVPGGSSATHTYSNAGTYTVRVTVTDDWNQSATSSMTLTVAAANNGGGTSGDNGGSGDGSGGNSAVQKVPMKVLKLRASVKFGVPDKDTCQLSGVIPALPALFNPAGMVATVSVGGVPASFNLDGKGRGKTTQGAFQLKLKFKRNKATKKSEFLGGDVPFIALIKNGSWSDDWTPLGVDPAANAKKTPLVIGVDLTLNGTTYTDAVSTLYSAKAGKTGTLKK
jgi:PKD repeat protein